MTMKRLNEICQNKQRIPRLLNRTFGLWTATGIVIVCSVLGCTTFDLSRKIPWMDSDEVKQPSKITVLWSNTVLNEPGRRGVRGFGGRIMFHESDHAKAIRVKGALTVFAFDVTKRVSSAPDKKFAFTTTQFDEHYSKSKLGHSYSIWLPWDEVGGEPRRISLVARFEPEDGSGVLLSEDSVQVLPGITRDVDEDAPRELSHGERSNGIEQAGYQEEDRAASGGRKDQRKTLTTSDPIDLPPSFARRIGNQDYDESSTRDKLKKPANRSIEKPIPSIPSGNAPDQDRQSNSSVTPYEQLMERQKELSDRFGRQRFQARRTSSPRPKASAPPKELAPQDERSRRLPSSPPELKDPFESDDPFESAASR